MRAFLALEFPERLKRRYGEARPGFEAGLSGMRWVRPECLHLTLRFLGETNAGEAEALREPVLGVAGEFGPADLTLGEPGVFGPARRPRVLWFGISGGDDTLVHLRSRLEQVVRERGFSPDDKPWSPHVTVARGRRDRRDRPGGGGRRPDGPNIRGEPPGRLWPELALASGLTGEPVPLDAITLLSSELTPKGPVYRPVWKVRI